jgi:hypothetical protein
LGVMFYVNDVSLLEDEVTRSERLLLSLIKQSCEVEIFFHHS